MTQYRNIEDAFLGELREVMEQGKEIEVQNSLTREVRNRVIEVNSIRDRYVLLPRRNNNVFASIAESMWVLAGRNDIEYLGRYLPRAHEFSDDGQTWGGAYGPRLRNWNGLDQLAKVIDLLSEEPSTRRAVIMLFDPDRDFTTSKDIPCNNWLHFLARNGQLDLNVAARSTDIWWGFSGINAFEWSLLLEMMSFWLGFTPGRLTFFVSSLHIYERHFSRAKALLVSAHEVSDPQGGRLSGSPEFATSWKSFDSTLAEWMRLETRLHEGADLDSLNPQITDPMMTSFIQMIDLFWAFKRGEAEKVIAKKLLLLGDTNLQHAASEFLSRKNNQHH